MDYKDYYKTLGVARSATPDEIKKAFRKLAREFHPDRNKAKGAEDRFKQINEANEVLSDPEKRKAYDTLGPNWKAGAQQPPPGWEQNFRGAAGRGRRTGGTDAGNAGFSDFFSSLFGNAAAGGMGGMGGAGFGGAADFDDVEAVGGHPQRAKLSISLEDSYHGGSRQVSLSTGRTLNVQIPKGVTAGQTIRLADQGARGADLLLEIEFAPHPQFKVEGRDIQVNVAVSPWEAALGGKIDVPTLGGTVELALPPGAASGRKLRLKGRGLPGTTPGDEFVTILIQVPAAESESDKAYFRDMARRFEDFKPRG
ncbi:MAG: hypothetical protein JWQ90_3390 [Hydrocarboniphaga sp.]|uniref:DnaJ C-terminal domain-containing protein n=1 Tax=Hydrocarboniphaga sp. TaxID=2033016 RepID=UPI002613C88A|nr:DnaJ C-terminal domain-containing protein [Hydrocarboniphaga sp.]MDB5970940.1 hypothetical protein [Hydrocarboniphaga sp.]